MKRRIDFVTNSSSSSFILAFDKDNSYYRFLEMCNLLDYGSLAKIVSTEIENSTLEQRKNNAKELLKNYFDFMHFRNDLIKERFPEYDGEFNIKYSEYTRSDEYDEKLNERLSRCHRLNPTRISLLLLLHCQFALPYFGILGIWIIFH